MECFARNKLDLLSLTEGKQHWWFPYLVVLIVIQGIEVEW
jgi:hypothetical protein